MAIDAVKQYMVSKSTTPYFLVVGDEQYLTIKDRLAELGFVFVRTSDYCSEDDKLPDMDKLTERIKTENVGQKEYLAVIGLGEYLSLCGAHEARNVLLKLKDMNIGKKRVVLLLRGMKDTVKKLRASDPRFDFRRAYFAEPATHEVAITVLDQKIGISVLTGYKKLLAALENSISSSLAVNTSRYCQIKFATLDSVYHVTLPVYPVI